MADCICKIIENKQLNQNCFDLTVLPETEHEAVLPGQFCHIVCGEKLLRRPISICMYDNENGFLRMVYRLKGEGTTWLSQQEKGEKLQILLPLGHGFEVPEKCVKPVFIGGGIGAPPMLYTAKTAVEGSKNVSAILGFRSKNEVILENDFKSVCQTYITTDDGSYGRHGFVTDVLKALIDENKCDYVAACGPMPMLKAIAGITSEHKISCQVSLEQRMGCGMGACLVCAVPLKINGQIIYARACKDGPVFDARRVDFDG